MVKSTNPLFASLKSEINQLIFLERELDLTLTAAEAVADKKIVIQPKVKK